MKNRNLSQNLLEIISLFIFIRTIFMTSMVQAHEEAAVAKMFPITPQAILQDIDGEMKELDKDINDNKLSEVHHHAYAIRDLVNSLLAHPENLSADKFAQVKENTKFVETIAKRLDESGDANDKKATIDNFTKLKKVLATINASYLSTTPK